MKFETQREKELFEAWTEVSKKNRELEKQVKQLKNVMPLIEKIGELSWKIAGKLK